MHRVNECSVKSSFSVSAALRLCVYEANEGAIKRKDAKPLSRKQTYDHQSNNVKKINY